MINKKTQKNHYSTYKLKYNNNIIFNFNFIKMCPIPIYAIHLCMFITVMATLIVIHMAQAAGEPQAKWLFYPLGFVICWAGAPTLKMMTGGFVKNRQTYTDGGIVVFLLHDFLSWISSIAQGTTSLPAVGANGTDPTTMPFPTTAATTSGDVEQSSDESLLRTFSIVSLVQALGFYLLLNQYQTAYDNLQDMLVTKIGLLCATIVAVASVGELVLLVQFSRSDWHSQAQLILLGGFELRVLLFIFEHLCGGKSMAKVKCHATFPALFISCAFAAVLSVFNKMADRGYSDFNSIVMGGFLLQLLFSLLLLTNWKWKGKFVKIPPTP